MRTGPCGFSIIIMYGYAYYFSRGSEFSKIVHIWPAKLSRYQGSEILRKLFAKIEFYSPGSKFH